MNEEKPKWEKLQAGKRVPLITVNYKHKEKNTQFKTWPTTQQNLKFQSPHISLAWVAKQSLGKLKTNGNQKLQPRAWIIYSLPCCLLYEHEKL